MKNIMIAFGFIAALLSLSTLASAYPADCLLEVNGKTYIKGVCEFTPQGGGDFQVWGKEGYFAHLSIYDKDKDKNLAGLNWNADPASTHAQAHLGDVHRKGACWQNKHAKVCVRALSSAKRARVEAERPNGVAIELMVAGYPMVCLQGNSFEPGTELELDNCVGPFGGLPKLFKPSKGGILIDKHPGLCIDAKPTDKPNVSKLVLEDCKQVSRQWHALAKESWHGKVIHSEDGLCWNIPDLKDPSRPFPFKVMATPCHDKMNENAIFDFYKGG